MEIIYKPLSRADLTGALFGSFHRFQDVKKCWRLEKEKWVLRDIHFTEEWDDKDFAYLLDCLQNTLDTGGAVLGAFLEESLIGFASVENNCFGTQQQYLQLSSLHVSYEYRGYGIGKSLFQKACLEAEKRGAIKLYISAHSALETIAFYQRMGCTDAAEQNKILVKKEPCDRQMEYLLKSERKLKEDIKNSCK